MSENKWTNEQKKAITASGCNILVAAAAGSGKTAVLVERIIRKITDQNNPIDIDKLLVVTFTNAAAAEMRERIGTAISKALDENPASKQLQRQLTLLTKANIMTMHSFCLDVIRTNFHNIDLDPNFRIADDTESILIRQECVEELLERKYEEKNKEFLAFAECFSDKDDRKLESLILSLHNFVKSYPWPEKWLIKAAENFNIDDSFDFEGTPWAKILFESVHIELSSIREQLAAAVNMIKSTYGLQHYLINFEEDEAYVSDLLNCESLSELSKMLQSMDFKTLSRKRVIEEAASVKERVKAIRDDAKGVIKSLKDELNPRGVSIEDSIRHMYPVMKCLSDAVIEFDKIYSDKKREKGILDFSDIEHFCLDILTKHDIDESNIPAERYIEKFEEILIDEYQDSNLVQEEIMSSIARKKDGKPINIFMVGDVKQSIYRFRQAMPELFLEKYKDYPEDGNGYEMKVKLFKNFRSRKEILSGVNYIFTQIMSSRVGELDYTQNEALNYGADYKECDGINCGGDIEIHILEKAAGEENDFDLDEDEIPDNIQLEARLVAKKIKEVIYGGSNKEPLMVYDNVTKTYRNAQFRDIVILMRATFNWSSVFMEELSKEDIPVYADVGTGYFETSEIRTMLSLLEIIDNPLQDIPLIGVLRSPIASFSPEELIDIRLIDKEIPYYEALKKSTTEKAHNFIKRLEQWRKKSVYLPIDEFIWYLYIETGFYGFAGAMVGGTQRQANLRLLFEKAKAYEKTSLKGLFNFIDFIRKLKSSSADFGSAKMLGEEENVVRIMSIHKSKGLEFPVVIVSGMGKQFNKRDVNSSILFHIKMGFGPDYIEIDRRISYPTIVKQALKKKINLEMLSEEMRILYVAFTRAKEKLIITGSVRNLQSSAAKWCSTASKKSLKLSEYDIIKSANFLDWICPALARHSSGESIRAEAGITDIDVVNDGSSFSVKFWSANEFLNSRSDNTNEDIDIIKEIESLNLSTGESKYKAEIDRRLSWNYRLFMASSIPAKISVTELKNKFYKEVLEDDEQIQGSIKQKIMLRKPQFLLEEKKTAAQKGTLMHLVMQHIDLKNVNTKDEIKSELDRLANQEFLSEDEAKSIDINKIINFFNSDIGKRMIHSKNVKREVPFYMEIKCTEIYKELDEGIYGNEKVMLQGIIDCYFEENDDIVLLDYKTDFAVDTDVIKNKYKIQLEYYAKALKEMSGKNIKDKYIYLFYNNKTVKL
jgi:ATP-dependent helicase/nuclease subunit A